MREIFAFFYSLNLKMNLCFLELVIMLKGDVKKTIFFRTLATKALSPPPLGLVVKRMATIKKEKTLKKVLLFLVDNPLPPLPLLVDCPLKKRTLFAVSLTETRKICKTCV